MRKVIRSSAGRYEVPYIWSQGLHSRAEAEMKQVEVQEQELLLRANGYWLSNLRKVSIARDAVVEELPRNRK